MKIILITGGTGSLGQELTKQLLENPEIQTIRVFSRDEHKQEEMRNKFENNDKIKFFLGDIRNKSRLNRALENVDVVIHCAALKNVQASNYNPFEYVETNVIGSQNLIDCCIDRNVNMTLAISTDKAVNPISVYGATKLLMENLFITANNYTGGKKIRFGVLRLGNLFNSNGSVVKKFKQDSILNVTDLCCTRFSLTLRDAALLVIKLIYFRWHGVYVPKLKAYNLADLVKSFNKPYKIIGLREGEKLHEELDYGYTSNDAEKLTVSQLTELICE